METLETDKQSIVKALKKHRRMLTAIVDGLSQLDEVDDKRFNRILAYEITITLFEFIDAFVDTEMDIHNFMKGRG